MFSMISAARNTPNTKIVSSSGVWVEWIKTGILDLVPFIIRDAESEINS